MKRFWVFVVICIVSLGIGFTIFRFMTLDEVVYVNQTVFEVNVGDTFTLDIVKKNLKKGSKVETEIGDDNLVGNTNDEYTFTAKKGGQTTITVSSNIEKFIPVKVQVTVGSGEANSPYFIKDATDLAKIGSSEMPLNRYYKLTSDINMTGVNWTPIANGIDEGFNGTFDFNGHTISNLNLGSSDGIKLGGLFATIGSNGKVANGKFANCVVEADFDIAGVLAGVNKGQVLMISADNCRVSDGKADAIVGGLVGKNNGTISKASIENSSVDATASNAIAGGLVGVAEMPQASGQRPSITISYAKCNVSATQAAGGLVGVASGALIENCYTGDETKSYKLNAKSSNTYLGGIVGLFEYDEIGSAIYNSSIIDTYSVMDFEGTTTNKGAILGYSKNKNDTYSNEIAGNYYSKTLSGNVNSAISNFEDATTKGTAVGVYERTADDLKTKTETYYSYTDTTLNRDYSWQLDTVWTMNDNAMPTLNFDCQYVASRSGKISIKGEIKTQQQFLAMNGSSDNYKLMNNITFKVADGYQPIDFAGRFTCPLDENGNPEFTITLEFASDSMVKDGVASLFNTLSNTAIIENISVNISVPSSVKTATKVAGIAGTNNGIVNNCYATGSITTGANGKIYMAGIVAENKGTVQDCKSSVEINMTTSCTQYYVGGVVAYNQANSFVNGSVYKGSTNGNKGITVAVQSKGNLGGIVGETQGNITSCVNRGVIDGSTVDSANSYIGGIVGYLSNATVSKCSNQADISGMYMGGVVGFTTGRVSECESKGATLTGKYVGGVASVQMLGVIENCYTENFIQARDTTSVICGISYQVNVTYDADAVTNSCFSANQFGGSGDKYYECASTVRGSGDIWAFYEPDAVYHSCIYVAFGGAKAQVAKFEAFSWFGYFYDCPVTEDQAKSKDLLAIVTSNSKYKEYEFKTSIWEFADGQYPTLKNVAK